MELGIVIVALIVLLIAFFLWYPWFLKRRPGRRFGGSSAQSGLVRGMDEIWHPESMAPHQARDEEQRWVEPAPTPDKDRGAHDGGIRDAINSELSAKTEDRA